MSMATLEREILAEAKEVTGKKNLRMKDILEWSSGEVTAHKGEVVHHLPSVGVKIAIKE